MATETLIALIDSRNKEELPESENLGLSTIASFLREKDFAVELFSLDTTKPVAGEIEKVNLSNKIYGFSIFHENIEFVYDVVKMIKLENPASIICAGSKFATEVADQILQECPYIDLVVLGDGEFTMFDIATSYPDITKISNCQNVKTRPFVEGKKVGRVSFEQVTIPPAHDFSRNSFGRPSVVARLFSKRGCTCYCTFCLLPGKFQKKTKKFSGREMQDLYAEAKKLNVEYGFRAFMIHDCPFDDAGTLGIKRIEQFCDILLSDPQNMSFECIIDGKFFNDTSIDLIKKMRRAGFSQIMYLVGAGSSHDEQTLKNQNNIKQKELAIDLFAANDVEVMLEYFAYHPFSTIDSFAQNYEFLIRRKAYVLDYFIHKAPVYFGTELHNMCITENLLKQDYSFKNVYEYDFKEPYMSEVNELYAQTIRKSPIVKEGFSFHNFVYLCNWLKVLFPDGMAPIIEEAEQIKQKLHLILRDYFDLIMVKRDLVKGRTTFPDLEAGLLHVYGLSKRLQMQQLRQPEIRKYLIRN